MESQPGMAAVSTKVGSHDGHAEQLLLLHAFQVVYLLNCNVADQLKVLDQCCVGRCGISFTQL